MLHGPRLAILDEPFSGFDPVNQDLTVNMIRELSAAGITIILSAHHMDLVETLADKILLMHNGKSVLTGSMDQIRRSTSVGQRLNLGFADRFDPEPLKRVRGVQQIVSSTADTVRLALEADASLSEVLGSVAALAPISNVHTETPTLREIYLSAVGAQA